MGKQTEEAESEFQRKERVNCHGLDIKCPLKSHMLKYGPNVPVFISGEENAVEEQNKGLNPLKL